MKKMRMLDGQMAEEAPVRIKGRVGRVDDPKGKLHNQWTWQIRVVGNIPGHMNELINEINSLDIKNPEHFDTRDQAKAALESHVAMLAKAIAEVGGFELAGMVNMKTGEVLPPTMKAPLQ